MKKKNMYPICTDAKHEKRNMAVSKDERACSSRYIRNNKKGLMAVEEKREKKEADVKVADNFDVARRNNQLNSKLRKLNIINKRGNNHN